ncbi:hypothetical protein P3C24_13460 [Pseudomonas proteolytica]|uniref:hypothetical protein n=1 Tax=Pseudomonas proteolytica TaxID=219574 RepID=UPI0023DF6912|nr:hypothetical protein [Pseudomonas proteolytica]MDF3161965.1 hypothetical protein [Pseudomonas proteolytica]
MLYSWLLIVHLLAAIAFIGTLFFEVFIWHRAREELAWSAQFTSDHAIARRSRQVLHGVVVLLYGAGIGLAWHYRGVLGAPWASPFSAMLSLKIMLALSIIGHYLLLAYWLTQKRLSPLRAVWIRRSILGHMVLIVILAKLMLR